MYAAFEASTDDNKRNLLFGSSGIELLTLDHWRDLLDDAFKLIKSLRAELFKSSAETQKGLAENLKEKVEGECLHAALKLDQTQAELDAARQASDARARDLRARAVQDAFIAAENAHGMQLAAKGIAAKLLSLSPGKTPTGLLKARITPLHPTGLIRSPSPASRVINRASREHAQRERGASRAMEATDSRALHRSTSMLRQDRTLQLLNVYVAEAGPLNLQGVQCQPESDTKAHNDYKAKVRA